jgi:2TM family of unknown function (DUF5676)
MFLETFLSRQGMTNTGHFLKVTALWMTIVYIVCFGGVALVPGIRPWFVHYALHMNVSMGENVMTTSTFFSGLVIWNVVTLLGVWLFGFCTTRSNHEKTAQP